jgi:hypothetical protein
LPRAEEQMMLTAFLFSCSAPGSMP